MPSDDQLRAFKAYDFESDARWKGHLLNLTIPPGRDEDTIINRYKQKFFKRFIDPDFEVESLAPAPTPPKPQVRSPASEQSARPPPPPQHQPQPRAGNVNDYSTPLFGIHCLIILAALVAIVPLVPGWIGTRAYRLSLVANLFASAASLLLNCGGFPSLTLASLKQKLEMASSGQEIFSVLYSFVYLSSPKPIGMALIPVAMQTLPLAAEYLTKIRPQIQFYQTYLEWYVGWILQNRSQLSMISANVEVTLGFLVIFYLFTPQRSFMMVVSYWQLLKLKFNAPASMWFHRKVWSDHGQKVEPLLRQYAPSLVGPLEYAKRWFQAVR